MSTEIPLIDLDSCRRRRRALRSVQAPPVRLITDARADR
jgi:hypothetical protein